MHISTQSSISQSNADALSRLSQPTTSSVDFQPGDLIHLVNHLSATTVTAACIKEWTSKDPVRSKVKKDVMTGWQDEVGTDLKPYRPRWLELSTLDGCVLWKSRVVVLPQGRAAVLGEPHETHPVCSKMKALSRSDIRWLKMDTDIEDLVKRCSVCQESRLSPPTAQLHPWQWSSQLWSTGFCRTVYGTHILSHC